MKETFTAIVIGGPRDGEIVAACSDDLFAYQAPTRLCDRVMALCGGDIPRMIPGETIKYRRCQVPVLLQVGVLYINAFVLDDALAAFETTFPFEMLSPVGQLAIKAFIQGLGDTDERS